ncbi:MULTISPECIES: hypothetical protein [Pseudonocardia]|uniref:Uncharacterized protein n=2 Tax=Pseudonocardia TaxID=1847 RepID=A0A1Y2N8R3_PSEAH|nr:MULTISPECIES: hypothetical protein [Pseudonocardia]OSY43308.1 hypothetical protein BG845_00913 [Pseudonocardia autotrophica]TDN71796.1 hypothetical protein C8E95_0830 [Pseudonocardia autotrophica]BBG02483.1 hypothetical protein Pdca_36920 [Pseudonocardia autotrophica]GEC26936.1 hypothetical protein PSA01_39650 [Pseudonocardia saturnea]
MQPVNRSESPYRPRHAAPDVLPARPVEPAAGPDRDGGLPGFPEALLPRQRSSRLIGAGLVAGIAGLLAVFTGVVVAADRAGAPISSVSAAGAAITEWRDGGGQVRVTRIADDLDAIARAGSGPDLAAMGQACRALRDDVATARAYPPIPDARAQASWAAGLTAGAGAARNCVAGAALRDAGLLGAAADDLRDMSGHLDDVAARIAGLAAS